MSAALSVAEVVGGQQRAAVLGRSLHLLGLRARGAGRVLPAGPGHRRRELLYVPVFGGPVPGGLKADGSEAGGSVLSGEVVLKYVVRPTEVEQQNLVWEHRVMAALYLLAAQQGSADNRPSRGWSIGHGTDPANACNPIPQPLQAEPLTFDLGGVPVVVSARHFVPASEEPFTARSLGRLIARLHQLGASRAALDLLSGRRPTPLCGLDPDLFARTLADPSHPFHARPGVLKALMKALQQRVTRALEADDRPLLVHRDLHPLNCVAGPLGTVALDWAEAGWGSRSEDFAWIHLAVARYGVPPQVLAEALAGYEDVLPGQAPTLSQIRVAGQAREVVCLAFSVLNAGRSAAHLMEACRELPILEDPDAVTARWLALFNPGIFEHPMFAAGPEVISVVDDQLSGSTQNGDSTRPATVA